MTVPWSGQSGAWIQSGAGDFHLFQNIWTACRTQPDSCSVGCRRRRNHQHYCRHHHCHHHHHLANMGLGHLLTCSNFILLEVSLMVSVGSGVISQGYSSQGMKLTTHFQLVLRLRMGGGAPLFPHFVSLSSH